jgi:hypothetical protein
MCDYSLCGLPTRLANEGESLIVHRFHTQSKGFASPADLEAAAEKPAQRRSGLWGRISGWFSPVPFRQAPAVCIPPGARLLLRDIPERLQQRFGVRAEETVTFVQLSIEAYQYRDAIQFVNGRDVLLQHLEDGQRAEVLCLLSPAEKELPAKAVAA